MQTVTIGIPTYNRINFLKIMSASLYRSDLSIPHNIRVYDDCSSEYGKDTLEDLFPTAKSIKINSINLRADKNIYQMYVDFLSTNDDYFFNADSDIIFTKEWLKNALEMIEKTDGILSLFNTVSHEPYQIIDDLFCLKHTIGSAGTLFKRECVSKMIKYFDSIEKIKGFDWQWCEYLTKNNIKIFCVNTSLVQHIGYTGQNSALYFDVGRGFKIETVEDGQIINDIFVESLNNMLIKWKEYKEFRKKINERENNLKYHFFRCLIIIIKILMPKIFITRLKKIFKKYFIMHKKKVIQ
jgi:hypothetical protein